VEIADIDERGKISLIPVNNDADKADDKKTEEKADV
jgi:hypothetical protein